MTTSDRDEGPFEGIDVELPFVSFRAGKGGWRRGTDMDDDRAYRLARRRVREKLNFYRHVATFTLVIGLLALIDFLTGTGWWVHYVAAIWGAIIVFQGANTFLFRSIWSRETEERMIEDELRKMGRP